ncbi:MAG: hypothetical protein KDB40_24410 [Acidimicrobiales bacterium]|nr:hypothetical protein [Acidimicrobiales bacterium]MCB9392564.1 hypothetical protein [Acidimicrobiaceae bacterium]
MLRVVRLALATLAVALVPAAVASAADYGPNATPTLTGTTGPTSYTINGQGFCADTAVLLTIDPTSASNEFPHTAQTNASGEFSYTVAKPTGTFTITATGQSAVAGCDKTATIGPIVLSAGAVAPPVVSSQTPTATPSAPASAAGDILPVTGSDSTSLQVRNALAALGAGVVLVVVAGRRRAKLEHRSLQGLSQL